MQKVDALLTCGDIVSLEIDAAIFAPKIGMKAKCERHGIQIILKVSVPYQSESRKTTVDPGQEKIK